KRYGTLLWLLDSCQTAMGSRNLTSWINNPLLDINKINYRLDGVEELFNDALMRNAVREILSNVRDTERLTGKVSNGNITPRDCESLAKSLSVLPKLKDTLKFSFASILCDVNKYIADFKELSDLLLSAIKPNPPTQLKDGGYIADGFDKELDRLRNVANNSESIIRGIEEREREATGIKTLKINYNKVFGYYIEVTNSFKDKVPYSYVRKQTLVGAERFITEELKALEDEVLGAKERALKLEADIFSKIKSVLLSNLNELHQTSRAIACLDTLTALAYVSKKQNYVRPTITDFGTELKIVDGRHPVVEYVSDENFIPNDSYLNNDTNRMNIITGPNMAGKSTYMRQIALITIMAHIGSFVPCKSAVIPLTDRIFTRVGASDNLIFDQSTFMVEMSEVAVILNKATKNSLLILDEVGRGTSTYDGLSIAWAVVEYITSKIGAKTLFATHYHELSELEGKLEGVKNYKITVKELGGKIIFLRKIAVGSANKSFGIEVASLAGVPKEITSNAKRILKKLEQNDTANVDYTYEEPIEVEEPINEEINEILSLIEGADIDSMSPRQALDFIYELKNKVMR
ncbi:MAG: DNA mismatch repair protein MutS, partial [Clostridia bacterium]|nr:DNA mismatch repair protein MutS [Clostridia bacterium]